MNTQAKAKTIERACVVCGRDLTVTVDKATRRYTGGHYFGKMRLRWWQRAAEYWECDSYYRETQS